MKCVVIINENLPVGLIANTAAILGGAMAKQLPDTIGKDVYDKNKNLHAGIITFPVPVLKTSSENIKKIRQKLYQTSDLYVTDFSDLAQKCKTYDEFIQKMQQTEEKELQYFGIAICGKSKKVNQISGNIPLLK